MKTLNNFKRCFPVLTFLLVLSLSVNAQGNSIRANEKNEKKWENSKVYKNDKEPKTVAHREVYQPSYSKKWYRKSSNFYEHRDYGRVYRHFENEPMVFRYNRGNYYYYGNHFYTYRKGIGYCITETPRNIYFASLPNRSIRVNVNGRLFFRAGDLFFQKSPRGYVLVPAPVEINISARF